MAFPSSIGTAGLSLQQALSSAQSLAGQIKQQATALSNLSVTNGVGAQNIISFATQLTINNVSLTNYASITGMEAYAQAQLGNASLDIAGAFNTMQAAIVSTISWITANFPTDSGGYLQFAQWNGGTVSYTTFTPAQLTGFSTVLNTLIATIN